MSEKMKGKWYIEEWFKGQAAAGASIPPVRMTLLVVVCVAYCGAFGWMLLQAWGQDSARVGSIAYYAPLIAFGCLELLGVIIVIGCLAGIIYRFMPKKKVEEQHS